MDKKTQVLSPEDIDKIKTLDIRKINYLGKEKKGYFDAENGLLYFIDENGNLNGEAVSVKKIIQSENKALEEKTNNIPAKKENTADKTNKVSLFKEKLAIYTNADKKKKTIFIIILLIAGLVIISSISSLLGGSSQNISDSSSIAVVQMVEDAIPSDIITKSMINPVTISKENYQNLLLNGVKVYKWENYESLLDKSICTYVSKGQYLTYDDVATVYTPPVNPWLVAEEGYSFLEVDIAPELADKVNFGVIVDVYIRNQRLKNITYNDSNNTKYDETLTEESYMVTKYEFTNAPICDILNNSGDSIFNNYSIYMLIPAGEQLPYIQKLLKSDEKLLADLTPSSIIIKIPATAAAEIGNMNSSNNTSEVKVTRSIDESSSDKNTLAKKAISIQETIYKAVKANKKEAENI